MRSIGPGLTGICHACKNVSISLKFCRVCGHWFGDCCRYSGARVRSALQQEHGPGCCGPTTERMAEVHG